MIAVWDYLFEHQELYILIQTNRNKKKELVDSSLIPHTPFFLYIYFNVSISTLFVMPICFPHVLQQVSYHFKDIHSTTSILQLHMII